MFFADSKAKYVVIGNLALKPYGQRLSQIELMGSGQRRSQVAESRRRPNCPFRLKILFWINPGRAEFDRALDFVPAVQAQFEKSQHPKVRMLAEGRNHFSLT